MPQRRAQGLARTQLRDVSHDVDQVCREPHPIRSQPDGLSAGRRTRHGDLRLLSHHEDVVQDRRLCQLRDLPQGSAPRAFRQQLLVVSYAAVLEDEENRPLAHGVPAARGARLGAVRLLPRQARAGGEAAIGHVRRVSYRSTSRRVQAGLRQLSYRDDVQEDRHRQHSQRLRSFVHAVPAGRCPRHAGLCVVSHRPDRHGDRGQGCRIGAAGARHIVERRDCRACNRRRHPAGRRNR